MNASLRALVSLLAGAMLLAEPEKAGEGAAEALFRFVRRWWR